MSDHEGKYKTVSMIDVNQLLTFAKKEYEQLEEQIKEEKRVEKELKEFVSIIEKHSGHKIHYIGHEKRFGKHLVRFLLKDGGFVEVMVEKPLVINGHFISKNSAEKFLHGLKKALEKVLPENQVKKIFIDSLKVEDGFKDEVLTLDKWERMHKLVIHKTVVITFVAIIIFIIVEIIVDILTEVTKEFFSVHSAVFSMIVAVFLALFFEPIKEKMDAVVARILNL